MYKRQELDSGLHAKLQFVTQGIADRYGALQLSAISRTRGEIDRVTCLLYTSRCV